MHWPKIFRDEHQGNTVSTEVFGSLKPDLPKFWTFSSNLSEKPVGNHINSSAISLIVEGPHRHVDTASPRKSLFGSCAHPGHRQQYRQIQ